MRADDPGRRRPRALLLAAAVASLGMAVALVWSSWPRPDPAEGPVRDACRAARFEVAARLLAPWLARAPDSARARYWQARIALALRRPEEASTGLKRARELGHDPGTLRVLEAIAGAMAGRRSESEPVLREAFRRQEEADPLLDEVLARLYLENYELVPAGRVLERWRIDVPDDPRPHLWQAEIDGRTGQTEAVMRDYREALKRDPGSARARLGLGEELRKAHRVDEAAEHIDAYVRLRPDDPAGRLAAGRLAAERGLADAAGAHLGRVIELDPGNASALRELADLLLRRGELVQALGLLDRAVAADPYEISARHTRGLILARLGRDREARKEQTTSARLRAEQDQLLAAQARLVTAPRDLASRLVVTRWMFAHGKEAEGVRWAEAILKEDPSQPDACRLLADAHTRAGRHGLANLYRARAADGPKP